MGALAIRVVANKRQKAYHAEQLIKEAPVNDANSCKMVCLVIMAIYEGIS